MSQRRIALLFALATVGYLLVALRLLWSGHDTPGWSLAGPFTSPLAASIWLFFLLSGVSLGSIVALNIAPSRWSRNVAICVAVLGIAFGILVVLFGWGVAATPILVPAIFLAGQWYRGAGA